MMCRPCLTGDSIPSFCHWQIIGLFESKRQSPGMQFEKSVWGGFALLFILIVFFTRDMRIRYIAPAIPPLVILSVFGIRNVYSWVRYDSNSAVRQGLQIAAALGVMLMLTLNALYIYQKWESVRPLEYIGGQVDRAAYITRHRPEYPLVRYANQHLMKGDRILCVFLGNRRYYFEIDTLFYEWSQFKDLVVRASDAQSLDRRHDPKRYYARDGWYGRVAILVASKPNDQRSS